MAEKKTTTGKRSSAQRSASSGGDAPRRSGSREISERQQKIRRQSVIEDLIVIVVIALSVLCYVAIFTSAIPWLKTALYFLFGKLMYVAPLLFVALAIILRIHDKTGLFVRRIIAAFLILFAVSGLFAFFSEKPEGGGLLGRLNYVMMHKLLGVPGATVVNIFLIIVSVVLFVDFSIFSYLKEKRDPSSEENQKKRALQEEQRSLRREERSLKRENRQLEEQRKTRESINEYSEKNRRMRETDERLSRRFVGIGDTTIMNDEETEPPTTFRYGDEDASVKNSSLFNKYRNSGQDSTDRKVSDKDDVPFDLSDEIFMPNIHLGDEFLPADGEGIVSSETPEETPEERAAKADRAFKEQLSPTDRYEKIVVTANGAIRRVATDAPRTERNKEVIDTDASWEATQNGPIRAWREKMR